MKRVYFVCGRMICIVLRDHRYNIIILNVHSRTEEKTYDSKDTSYQGLEQVFLSIIGKFEILMQNWGERIFTTTTGNES